MKDEAHHIRSVQKKVLQSIRKESSSSFNRNTAPSSPSKSFQEPSSKLKQNIYIPRVAAR